MPDVAYKQGDIVLIDFPFTNLTESKVRPALIISNDLVNKTNDVVCVMITGEAYKDAFTFEIKDSDVTHSLDDYSEIRCHKGFTVHKSKIKKKISYVHATTLNKVFSKIKTLLL